MSSLNNKLLLLLLALACVSLITSSSTHQDDDDDDDDDNVDLNLNSEIEDDNSDEDTDFLIPGPGIHWPATTPVPGRPLLGVPGCGLAPASKRPTSRVVFGYNASYGEFPSYVRLTYGNKTHHGSCGGTLISDRHVLTAMHCVAGLLKGDKLEVILGDLMRFNKDSHEITIGASHVKCTSPHYFHKGSKLHDWVLIELKHSVVMNDYIQPACLPRSHKPPRTAGDLSRCYLVGMGVQRFTDFDRPAEQAGIPADRLEKLRVEQTNCARNYGIYPNDTSRSCYRRDDGRTGGNSCLGDSGGPVLCEDREGKWTLVAIVSGGRVPYCGINSDWILYVTKTVFADVTKLLPEMDEYCADLLGSTKTPALPETTDESRSLSWARS